MNSLHEEKVAREINYLKKSRELRNKSIVSSCSENMLDNLE